MTLDEEQIKILSVLKRKRGVVKASLTRVRTFVNKFDPRNEAISLLEFRQEELPQINRKFDDIQCEIELIDLDSPEEAEIERENFEKEYYSVRSVMQEMINLEKSNNSSIHNASTSTNIQGARALLAPISLPTFNGNILEWESFFDCFKVLVHDEDMYSAAQKFSYLRSVLNGQALDVVKGIPMTEANYNVAIKKLLDRYDNKNLVIQSHIRSILDIPCMKPSSAKDLQELHSLVSTHVAALEALRQPVESWDAWLITIILRKLDQSTIHAWQMRNTGTELPKYSELNKFLAGRCVAFESTESWSNTAEDDSTKVSTRVPNFKKSILVNNSKKALVAAKDSTEDKCACCSDMHRLFMCSKFKEMPVGKRMTLVRQARLCFNCLSSFHMADKCKSRFSCLKCKRKHNTLLHYETQLEAPENTTANNDTTGEMATDFSNAALVAHQSNGHVFLPTVVALVPDDHGTERNCRAILDSGSQMNFVSKKFANLLHLPRRKVNIPVSGIGANQVQAVSCISLKVRSRINAFEVELVCHVLPTIIEGMPCCSMPMDGWNIPQELVAKLADPSFSTTGSIDLLIGGGIFFDLLEAGRVQLQTGNACLQETKFGWVITGEVNSTCLLALNSIGEVCESDFRVLCKDEPEIYGTKSKSNQKCIEEQDALAHFENTAKRDETGRFVLRLPLKSEAPAIGRTLEMATARFLGVERRLQRDTELRLQYTQFMEEYLKMGHMKKVNEEENHLKNTFYLPHHPVIKLSSLTTKLRVVFDASAKSTSKLSLNDVLLCGPVVQDDLVAILIRFRKHQFVITADVEKMFRQIKIAEEDQDWQRIVWRSQPDEALESYRLTTVTYGTTSASFMATNCIASLSNEAKENYPKASKIIRHDFYMDDLMTGADTIDDCCQLQQQINTILESANLPLRKWCSNSAEILDRIGKSKNDPMFALQIGEDDVIKSLGLSWKPALDEFKFIVENKASRVKSTKRMLLSDLNRIFDPLGFLAPILIRGKIFLQQLWQMKIEWDQTLPVEITKKWNIFYQEFNELSYLPIPRKCMPSQPLEIEIHGFCDASEEAYGSVIYVRSKDKMGHWHSRLLCARTRVAPLKGSTMPRLELCGALTLAQLAKKTAEAWELDIKDLYLWTDSMVILGWLNSHSSRLKTYVANRVDQILEITEAKQWRHIRSDENPADILSRGVTPKELQDKHLWWNGPNWLVEDSATWLESPVLLPEEETLPEKRPIRLVLIAVEPTVDLLNHYSKWHKLVRAAAWLLKFIEFRRIKNTSTVSKYLSVTDLKKAEIGLIKRAQLDEFGDELRVLKKGKEVSRRSKLKCLYPMLRKDNVILVGGRLNNAEIPEEQKHPIVLPANHKVTRLIFEDYHERLLHGGPQLLLSGVRQQYWPLRGRVMARSVTTRCVTCIRAKPTFVYPLMASLPKTRVQPSRPFAVSGVDFAGPLVVRSGVRRITGVKAWVAIFICFSTRAIHLEAVVGLTSGAFIATLRRFISRRGKCSTIYSDNGTNFVGAQKELASYIKNCDSVMACEGIEWKFNPPSAPHFGGYWESAVKSTKYHLNRVLKDSRLNLEELTTLLCQIEACVNSRPITPLSSDPSELEALTPGHFLIGGPLLLLPEPNTDYGDIDHLHRWKYVQALMHGFWNRWHREYLPQLQVRGKWLAKKPPLNIDDVVIVKDELMPASRWKLARVVKTHPGADGVIRVATIRLASGAEMKRPIVKLCALPTRAD